MYLAAGMTYEQFWEKESWLVKSYREAKKIQQDETNYTAWLHGVYVLQAIHTGVPVILQGIAKTHIDLPTYPDSPFDGNEEENGNKDEKQMKLQVAKMQEMVERFNAAFLKRQEAEEKIDNGS